MADIDTVHKCLGNTDLSIRLCFRLADCIFIPCQISHLRSAAVIRISSGSSRNAPGMSASVSTVVTEAWSVENYQQPGTVLVLARRKNSGSDAIKNNCIPYAVNRGVGRVKNSVRLGGGATTPIVPGRVREGGTPPAQQGGVGERCKLPHRGLGRSPRSQRF